MIGFNHLGIVGRLGNQMFQYAALRGIAEILMDMNSLFLKVISMMSGMTINSLMHFTLPHLKNRGKSF